MKLKEIHIKGWRSFDHKKGIILSGLRRINLIIGKNNSGKSNISKYLLHIKSMIESSQRNASSYYNYHSVPGDIAEEDTWAFLQNDIQSAFIFDEFPENLDGQIENFPPITHKSQPNITLKVSHLFGESRTNFSLLAKEDTPFLDVPASTKPKIYVPEIEAYVDYLEDEHLHAFDTDTYWQIFSDSLIFIDPIRHHSRGNISNKEYYFEGNGLIRKLNTIDKEQKLEMRKFEKNMRAWIIDILGEDIELDLNDNLRFILHRDGKEILENLDTLGTGVSQFFMLLSFLYWNRDKSLYIFLEEPENNLHPEALISFIKIIEKEFVNHTYFITTHSAHLIDQVNDDWTIHHITRVNDKSSKVRKCTEVIEHFDLLDDLGYRASQLVQSNIIIWVEGPSDRIYIKQWLHILTQGKLLEHKHYSFLMYGGSNLSGYDLFESDENISILKTSRYAIIVCDSDKKNENDNIKERVNKIYQQLSGNTEREISGSLSINEYVYLWITDGKEIENYIPNELFASVLNSDSIKKTRFNTSPDGSTINLFFDVQRASNDTFHKYSPFTDHFVQYYSTEVSSSQLTAPQHANITNHLNQKKVSIAKSCSKNWTENHFSDDLKSTLTQVIKLIKKANRLS